MDTLRATSAPLSRRPARQSDRVPPLLELVRDAARQAGPTTVAGAFLCLVGLAALFAPTLGHFATTWRTDENYSHGFLVPLLSLYFANEAARRGPLPLGGGFGIGVGLLILAVLGRLATGVVPIGFVGDISFLLGLAGLTALLAGIAALRRFGFALGFLIFMVPLPVALYSAIASPLQLMVSRLGGALLGLGGSRCSARGT